MKTLYLCLLFCALVAQAPVHAEDMAIRLKMGSVPSPSTVQKSVICFSMADGSQTFGAEYCTTPISVVRNSVRRGGGAGREWLVVAVDVALTIQPRSRIVALVIRDDLWTAAIEEEETIRKGLVPRHVPVESIWLF